MLANPMPWIILSAAVVVTLFFKGHLKLPVARAASQLRSVMTPTASPTNTVDVDALAKLGSHVLGVALAKAVRAEAEATIAFKMASDATAAIHATFTSPFSQPAPAGPDPSQAGGPPSP